VAPNPRLQRTPSAPLSRQPLGRVASDRSTAEPWRQVLVLAAVALFMFSCSKKEAATRGPSDLSGVSTPTRRVTPSPKDQCRLRLLVSRGNPGDLCMAKCIAGGEPGIAGGCEHICRDTLYPVGGSEAWAPPEGWSSCDALN
jgi:hypothetical protein